MLNVRIPKGTHMEFARLDREKLLRLREELGREYKLLRERGLALDLTRGKPYAEQLDLSDQLLALPTGYIAADGTDVRNYGGSMGLPELREIFAPLLQVPVAQLMAGDASSLSIMHDVVIHAMLFPLPGANQAWNTIERPAFICPVPGYDRHFSICEKFGIEMLPVEFGPDGPDLAAVERLLADPRVVGMWAVPKYSNPNGVTYSDETVRALASLPAANPGFRLIWDDAYTVHHLTDQHDEIPPILELCAEAGNPDRAFVFGSSSKITFAGAGVAFCGSSRANMAWLQNHLAKRTIGPDKVNHLRHAQFLENTDGVRALMEGHAALLAPKFAVIGRILEEGLGGLGVAEWTTPRGGYFVSVDVLDGCATEVVRLAKEAGVSLTPAGATFPYGKDPRDRNIRIGPSYPSPEAVEEATSAFVLCAKLAAVAKLLD